jgi:alkylated DNA repair dioxygenase AlkB
LAVREALEYIQKKAELVLGHLPELNEVLSAAYLEEQKMTFHSDDEKGLGPIVAALSLGSPAVMQYRHVPCGPRHSMQKHKKNAVLTLELRHVCTLLVDLECGTKHVTRVMSL